MDASIEDQNLPLPWLRQGFVITTAGLPTHTMTCVLTSELQSYRREGRYMKEGGGGQEQSSGNEPCDFCSSRFQI